MPRVAQKQLSFGGGGGFDQHVPQNPKVASPRNATSPDQFYLLECFLFV